MVVPMQAYSNRLTLFKRLMTLCHEKKTALLKLLALKGYFLAIVLLTPLCYLVFIRDVLEAKRFEMIWFVLASYMILYAMESLGIVLQKRIQNQFFMPLKLKIRKQMARKLSTMDHETYKDYMVGDLNQRLDSDVEVVQTFFTTHCIESVYAAISALVLTAFMFYINWILTLIGLVAVPLSFLFASFMSKKPGRIADEFRTQHGLYETDVHNAFQNWRMIKSHGLEHHESDMVKKHWDVLTPLFIKKQVFWFINRSFIAIKDTFITTMNLYFVGGILVINGQLELGLLLMFMNYYAKFYTYIEQIIQSIMSLKIDDASLRRVMEILDTPQSETIKSSILHGHLNMQAVSYAYSDNEDALVDVTLNIHENAHIAIVGRSGSGKSTLIKLLMGTLKPTKGQVHLGEHCVSDMSREAICKRIAVVMQEPYFFNLSIAENLKMANKSATIKQLVNVCKQANIHEFIDDLPETYDTVIGEKGIKLSGGQKQRLAIARMLLMNADILIFDEATSALDHENEKSIISTLAELKHNKTIISIAHRLSTITSADHVLVLERGRVVSEGTHEVLSTSCNVYKQLFKING
jgi:ATP-binding cassette subfamily B protein/subfamily B ATP-binding cassette protein MsbA